MKTIALILMLTIACELTSAQDGWYIPQKDGSLVWTTKEQVKAHSLAVPQGLFSTVIKFYLFTNANPEHRHKIKIGNVDSLRASNFDGAKTTRILIHGWLGSYDNDMNDLIRTAFLSVEDSNIISVDWSSARDGYLSSLDDVPNVGKEIARFIKFLHDYASAPLDSIRLVGHSLGAHIAGYAGKNIESGKVKRIDGLDPALPGFSVYDEDRLVNTDADFVYVIHTNGGLLGFLDAIGDVDFYVNGGKTQPACWGQLTDNICSHGMSHRYYADAVVSDSYRSVKCADQYSAEMGTCGDTYSTVKMGPGDIDPDAEGFFYVPVRADQPYWAV